MLHTRRGQSVQVFKCLTCFASGFFASPSGMAYSPPMRLASDSRCLCLGCVQQGRVGTVERYSRSIEEVTAVDDEIVKGEKSVDQGSHLTGRLAE